MFSGFFTFLVKIAHIATFSVTRCQNMTSRSDLGSKRTTKTIFVRFKNMRWTAPPDITISIKIWVLRGRIWENVEPDYGPRLRFWWNLAQRWVLAQNPPPTKFFWILTPKTGSFWGRKGRKISDFLNLFFTVKKARGHSEKNFVDKKVPFWAQERPREISRGYVKRRRRYGQFCEKRVLLVKVFYTRR